MPRLRLLAFGERIARQSHIMLQCSALRCSINTTSVATTLYDIQLVCVRSTYRFLCVSCNM